MSLPSRECGLKYNEQEMASLINGVTPLAGVWIEIKPPDDTDDDIKVTPLAGVWIEIDKSL